MLLVLLVFLVLLLLLVLLVLDQFLTACDSVLDTGKVATMAVLFGFVCLFLFLSELVQSVEISLECVIIMMQI